MSIPGKMPLQFINYLQLSVWMDGVIMDKISFIEPESDPRWDEYVAQHPHGWICHLSGWKKVLEKSFTHMKGYYPAIVDEAGTIKAALPVSL
jgi:hypothetical protein